MTNEEITIPIFPLPEVVLFPGMNLPLHVYEGRYQSLISKCLEGDKQFGVVYFKDNVCADVGTKAEIIDYEKLEDGKLNVLTEGRNRFKMLNLITETPYFIAKVESYVDIEEKIDNNFLKNVREIRSLSKKALNLFDSISGEKLSKKLALPKEPEELIYLVSANLTCTFEDKQKILESLSIIERAEKVLGLLKDEVERLEVVLENKKTKEVVSRNGKMKL